MGLLEVSPTDCVLTNFNPANEGPAAGLATFAPQHLNLVTVPVESSRGLAQEMLRRRTDVPIDWEAAVRACYGLRVFATCEGKFHLPSQVSEILAVHKNAEASTAVPSV
jgi:hypothetical protein